jgi:hypothetical protein
MSQGHLNGNGKDGKDTSRNFPEALAEEVVRMRDMDPALWPGGPRGLYITGLVSRIRDFAESRLAEIERERDRAAQEKK